MLVIPGAAAANDCDGVTRRDLLRVGGSGLLGLSLASCSPSRRRPPRSRRPARKDEGGPGFGKAKSVILVYLQGGPSHLDLWDPKDNVPDNVQSVFKHQATELPGMQVTELLPKLAQVIDKITLIRSMSYTPIGLFNHTAAIYQMLTGYTTDKVSPSGQLEPPSPKDFPTFGSNIVRLKPPTEPMLPFVMLPRPLQESNVVGKGGTAGFLGKAYDPYTLYPPGDDMDMTKMDRIKVDDLKLREEVTPIRLERRATLRETIDEGMPEIEQAVAKYDLDEYYDKALGLVISRPREKAFDLAEEKPRGPRAVRPQHVRPVPAARPPAGRSRHARRRGHLAEGRQLRQPLVGRPRRPVEAHEDAVGPDARRRPLGADRRPRRARPAGGHAGGRGRRVRPQPAARRQHLRQRQQDDGRDHWPYCYTAVIAGAGISRGYVHGKTDKTACARSRTRSTRPSCWRRSTTPSASTRTRSSTTTSTSRASWSRARW